MTGKLDEKVVKVKVYGEYACFTRPELKVERFSYPCMTPSAARGILSSILWKPEFKWYIRKIKILKPIKYLSILRNEIDSKQSSNPIVIEDRRTQRNSIILKEVAYIIEASIYLENNNQNNTFEKYVCDTPKHEGMFIRRLRKGQCWRQPYLGTREFTAYFSECDGTEQTINDSFVIESMLFDMYYKNNKIEPLFMYNVKVQNGILDLEADEQIKKLNLKMLESDNIMPSTNDNFKNFIYELNLCEERGINN